MSSNINSRNQLDFHSLSEEMTDLTDFPILEAFMEVSAEMSEEEPMPNEIIINKPSMLSMSYYPQPNQSQQPLLSAPYTSHTKNTIFKDYHHYQHPPPLKNIPMSQSVGEQHPNIYQSGKKSYSQSPSQSYSYDTSAPIDQHMMYNNKLYVHDEQLLDRPMVSVGSKSAPFDKQELQHLQESYSPSSAYYAQSHEEQWLQYCKKYYQQCMKAQQYVYQQQRYHIPNTAGMQYSSVSHLSANGKNIEIEEKIIGIEAKTNNKTISHLKRTLNEQKHKLDILLNNNHPPSTLQSFIHMLNHIQFPPNITQIQKNNCIKKLFNLEINKYENRLSSALRNRRLEAALNMTYETKIIQMNDDITQIKEKLENAKHENYLLMEQKSFLKNVKIGENSVLLPYPPENIIIQNLLRTQIEFYFSDYNLKRDKRMLDTLCTSKIGFLKLETIMLLSRVRQLSTYKKQIIQSIKGSKFLIITEDEQWVGRLGFHRPLEKQYPFRRTVFIFGLPLDCTHAYIHTMLDPFGVVNKIEFDHGPDSLDRLVAENMFDDQIKVYKCRYEHIDYNYCQRKEIEGRSNYKCIICLRVKMFDDGFYEGGHFKFLICLQCSAQGAEQEQEKCKNAAVMNKRMIELLCGSAPRDIQNTKTALAVFSSQRQASKCVYVRSRIAYDGCFTTHYHQYSKLKKDIAMTLKPHAHKLKEIPPRKVYEKLRRKKDDDGFYGFCEDGDVISVLKCNNLNSDGSIMGSVVENDHVLPVIRRSKSSMGGSEPIEYSCLALPNMTSGVQTSPVEGSDGVKYIMKAGYRESTSCNPPHLI